MMEIWKKNRAKRVSHDKTRRLLLSLVGIFGITILLGVLLVISYYKTILRTKKLKRWRAKRTSNSTQVIQKDHFRKGQAEVIAYYPLQGEEVIASVREKINQDIKKKAGR